MQFTSQDAQAAMQRYQESIEECESLVLVAADEWVVAMQDAMRAAMQTGSERGLTQAKEIRAALMAVEPGWPQYESKDHETLLASWEFQSARAMVAAFNYRKSFDKVLTKSAQARSQRREMLEGALSKAMERGGRKDLSEANRLHEWLKIGWPTSAPIMGWAIHTEQEAADCGLLGRWQDSPQMVHARTSNPISLKWVIKSVQANWIKLYWIAGDGEEVLVTTMSDGGSLSPCTGHTYAIRDVSGGLAAVLTVGRVEARILITDDIFASSGAETGAGQSLSSKLRVVLVSPESSSIDFQPWPGNVDSVHVIREELQRHCEEKKELQGFHRGILVRNLKDVRARVMRSGEDDALEESLRIQGAIDDLVGWRGPMPEEMDHWPFNSQDAKRHWSAFLQAMKGAPALAADLKLRHIGLLENSRAKVLRGSNPPTQRTSAQIRSALRTANEIQATIHQIEHSTDLCSDLPPPGKAKTAK